MNFYALPLEERCKIVDELEEAEAAAERLIGLIAGHESQIEELKLQLANENLLIKRIKSKYEI